MKLWVMLAGMAGVFALTIVVPGYLYAGGSDSLLERLADDAKLTRFARGAATHIPVDGTMPDTAERTYAVPALAPARAALVKACAIHELGIPSEDARHTEPDIVCAGRWQGRQATVHMIGQCAQGCRVTIEVRVI